MIGTGRPQTKDAPAFGRRLAAARIAKGWSQTELAERLGTTLKMIDYHERRANNPSVEFVRQAARVLGLSVAELLGEVKEQIGVRPAIFAILNEDLATIIAARDYVIQTTLDFCARFPGHRARILILQKFVVNRFPAAKFLSNTNSQTAGFTAHGNAFGKIGS